MERVPDAIEALPRLSFDRSVRRVQEAIELTRAYLSGAEDVTDSDELYEAADFPRIDRSIPVYNAPLGEANRRATGRVAYGWLPHNVSFAGIDEAFEPVSTAAAAVDRDPTEIEVLPYVPAAVSDDPARALDRICSHIAYYVGSGPAYERAVASRFIETAGAVAAAGATVTATSGPTASRPRWSTPLASQGRRTRPGTNSERCNP